MDIKENAKNIDVWTRGLFIVVFGVIFYFLYSLILLIVVFQFITKLITSDLNEPLLSFSDSLNKYVSQILLYITFKSEERPFPFSPWPGDNEKKLTTKKAAKKKVTEKEEETKNS